MQTRRNFLAASAAILAARAAVKQGRPVLLRSGWQTVNIGDITHTPGVLRLMQEYLPDNGMMLWPNKIDRGADAMLQRAFPKLQIVKGSVDRQGRPDKALSQAFQEAALFLHGSGDGVSSAAQMAEFHKMTGRPYGCFGVTVKRPGGPAEQKLRDILAGAAFVLTRETHSLKNLHAMKIGGKTKTAFAPDGTFSFDIRDDAKGDAFLKQEGLEPGKFIALVPRLRYTPYQNWQKVAWSEQETARRTKVNDAHAEADHAKLREVATAYVRKTGNKVLLCPEMTYELEVIGPLLYDPLPDDVKKQAVRRTTFWLPDEAASVYRHAAAVISFECHSPIIAAAQGTPCMYVHQPEDSIKGQMWPDIGLSDWYFEIEQATGTHIAEKVLDIVANPNAAKKKVQDAVAYARKLQADGMKIVRESLL